MIMFQIHVDFMIVIWLNLIVQLFKSACLIWIFSSFSFDVFKLFMLYQLFSFKHPEYSTEKSNQRYKKLHFEIPLDTGSAMVHGM